MRLWVAQVTIKAALALAVYLSLSQVALGYPEFAAAHEYHACSTCHVSPTGGGVLTPYGRTVADDMSTWTAGEASDLFFGLTKQPPDTVMVGGDQRYLSFDTLGRHTQFPMQMDAEIAVKATPEVTVDYSIGRYGPEQVLESRRAFVLWTPNELVHARVGRFFPAYGILEPDHTLATRNYAYDDGHESYNAEIAYHNKFGELYLTAASPADGTQASFESTGTKVQSRQFSYLVRAAGYPANALQVGLSGRYDAPTLTGDLATYTAGPYVTWGPTQQSYVLAEYDRQCRYFGSPAVDFALLKAGYEVYKGIHVETTHEYAAGYKPGLALDWYPFPHLQLLGEVKWYQNVPTGLFLVHSYW